MTRLLIVFIAVLLYANSVVAQNGSSDSICWNKNYKLKWSDFQGTASDENRWKAVSFVAIRAKGHVDKGLPNYWVFNCFVKKTSWTIDTESMDLLEHEQLHFDIAELHTRRIRKSIEELRKKKIKNYSRYEQTINQLLDEREAMDVKYDKETSHSMNKQKQKDWCERISKELKQLRKFSSH